MNVLVACLTSLVKNEFWIVGTDQNVISVNCHCCSLLHIAVSCCNQELLKCFKNSPDFWVIDLICMMLWLRNNHHFLFYFIFKKFETCHPSFLMPKPKTFKYPAWHNVVVLFWQVFLFSAFIKEILTRCFLPYIIDKCSERRVKRQVIFWVLVETSFRSEGEVRSPYESLIFSFAWWECRKPGKFILVVWYHSL